MVLDWTRTLELLIRKLTKQNMLDIFGSRDEEMFSRIIDVKNPNLKYELTNWLNNTMEFNEKCGKSSKISEDLRIAGNNKFRLSQEKDSLKLFNKSVIYAPEGSAELSLALGNRSAVLFRLKLYEETVNDINLALKNFRNDALFSKLMLRKIKSLYKMNRMEEANLVLQQLNESISSDHNLSLERKDQLIQLFKTQCHSYLKNKSPDENAVKKQSTFQLKIEERNNCLPFASSLLRLATILTPSMSRNRKVIAEKKIETGDVLFIEEPFSITVLPDYNEDHCQLCCKPFVCPIPCRICTNSLYCSESCQKRAYDLFHQWECAGMIVLKNLGVAHLAFRTTIMLFASKSDNKSCKQILNLDSHLNEIPEEDLIRFALTSALLAIYLSDYTDFIVAKQLSAPQISFSILQQINRAICNAFSIKKCTSELTQLEMQNLSLSTYATGMYPSAAMMNHSCLPNIVTSFYNNILIVRARQRIEIGEEIFNCYGPHAFKMNRADRKELLQTQFFFDCDCSYCKPEPGFIDEPRAFICDNCNMSFDFDFLPNQNYCRSCNRKFNFEWYQRMSKEVDKSYKSGSEQMTNGNFIEALDVFENLEAQCTSFMHPNNRFLLYNSLNIMECCLATNDYRKSWTYILKCVRMSEINFEPHDIEFANLIFKLTNLIRLINDGLQLEITRKVVDEIIIYIDRAVAAVEMNLGSWCEQFRQAQYEKQELTKLLMNLVAK